MFAPSKRDHLIDVAMHLFYQNGFTATGVDKIIQAAGMSKKTLYHYFRSKDELVLAVLRKQDELMRNEFMRNVERISKHPNEQILAFFDVADKWLRSKTFRGCMFINAAAEFQDQSHPCHKLCAEHKAMMQSYLYDLTKKADCKNPKELAEQLHFLFQGAIVDAHVNANKNAAQKAKTMFKTLISITNEA